MNLSLAVNAACGAVRTVALASLVTFALTTSALAADDHAGGHDHIGHAGANAKDLESITSVNPDLAIFSFVVFLAVMGVLWKFAWGPIVTGLEKREHGIAGNIAEAKRARDEAALLLEDYNRRLNEAAVQVRGMLDDARRDGEKLKQSLLTEARAAADEDRARGRKDIEAATENALKALAEQSANLAVDLAGKIVSRQLSPSDHDRLIHEAVAKFPETLASRN